MQPKKNRFNRHRIGRYAALAAAALCLVCAAVQECIAHSKEATEVHAPGYIAPEAAVAIPDSLPSRIKKYTGFTVSFNRDNRTPNWVAWELRGADAFAEMKRHSKFWCDDDLDGCPTTRDYSHSGLDRGHMSPAADNRWSEDAMRDCFVMANIVPQDHALNSGAWNTLEALERRWSDRDSAILIIAGPIYEASDTRRIGDAGVRVPSAFFKVLVAPYANPPRGIAYIFPNLPSPGNIDSYAMTIREAENATGYNFLPQLPDSVQDFIETNFTLKEWKARRR